MVHEATQSVFGFFVPYFERLVIRLPTPPCPSVSYSLAEVMTADLPDPSRLLPGGTSHLDNPAIYRLVPAPRSAAERCALPTVSQSYCLMNSHPPHLHLVYTP